MLEAYQYSDNCFATLTYRDENLPKLSASALPTLRPKDCQSFLKRLRKAIAPLRVRFYLVGEYGDETWRPHYHLALFGMPTCVRGRTKQHPRTKKREWETCCEMCSLVGRTWGHGDIDLGTIETSSAQYLAGYVTKKMTAKDDERLKGRHPEFSRMSLRPGIGFDAMHEVASKIMEHGIEGDVPNALRHGARELPLGRYLQRSLRKMVGRDEKTPQEVLDRIAAEMSELRESAFNASKSLRSAIVEANQQKRANFHAKQKLWKKEKPL